HEFYVQSRKRFPKEGKIVATKLGEEKVVSVDIFRERITLRGVEGEMRSVTLPEFKEETEQLTGVAAALTNGEEEENGAEGIQPDEISPELLYTAEHPVFVPRANAVSEPKPNGERQPHEGSREAEGPGKRRRGRRGGRRGRGGDEPNSAGNH
ncbi:MAG: hypothetical protein ABR585_14905, partial [Gemmatimonadaceae bacterium]